MPDRLKPCPDPKCGTDNKEDAEACSKCGLNFESFSAFDRFFTVRENIAAAKAEEDRKAAEAAKPKKKGIIWNLAGKKGE